MLAEADIDNMAMINNVMAISVKYTWMIAFDDFEGRNVLVANNTFWGARSTMNESMTYHENFVVINNIFGPRGGFCQKFYENTDGDEVK